MNKKVLMIDIMTNRKNNSDLCWIMKDYESKVSFFNNYKSSEFVKKNLLDSLNFKYDLKLLADKTGKTDDELLKEACVILNGMSHNIGMNSIRLMGYTLSKIIKQIYQHVYVNAGQMEKLRNAFSQSNVVLLPTHRSYADFLLMSYVMFQFDLPMPVIAAAMDFMNMKLVGELLRGCGAFFIKRSFASDELYWNVFSHYIKTLIELGQEPLEFFIEGTRSRTNKSLYPRIGLLGIVLELWLSRGVDIQLVPISISYDRVLEERLYAWELLGVPKPKESTSGLLKVRHILNDDYGNIYFNAGDPISISTLANMWGIRRSHHNLELKWKPALFEREKQFLRYLASAIVANQQQAVVLCDWTILAFLLMREASVTEARLIALFDGMCKLLMSFGAVVASGVTDGDGGDGNDGAGRVRRALSLHKSSVMHHPKDGRINVITGNIDAAGLEAKIVERIQLGNCRNPMLFQVARESVLLSRLRYGGTYEEGMRDVARDFYRLMALLSREFIYCTSSPPDVVGNESVDEAAVAPSTMTTSFDATVDRLVSVNLLVVGPATDQSWQPNLEHLCYLFVESAVHMHLLAYAIYGHIFINNGFLPSSSPPFSQLSPVEQCKSIQKCVMEMCASNSEFGSLQLEMCSLDIIRNAVARFNEIMKSHPSTEIQQLIDIIGSCISQETKQLLPDVCLGIFSSH